MNVDEKATLIIGAVDELCGDNDIADGELLRLLDRILEHIEAWYEAIEEG